MKIQYASFLLPAVADSPEQAALNRFLRSVRVVQIMREFIQPATGPAWAILVEYMDDAKQPARDGQGQPTAKIDYKEVLSPEDFAVFTALRQTRKSLAEEQGIPVYAVVTNEQLAAISRNRPKTLAELKAIDGIGDGKCEKFGAAFMNCLAEPSDEAGRVPF